ncbi:MAG: zinc-ribbon domain-containing protein, partial [Myxococcota bacterium]|nr:zinc-ribbon domain-containing protein [Myxococcota bacterium]
MNVACPSCPAKYAVPDEKVRGKKARITCKRCGSAIIVDGTSLQASKPPPKPRAEPLPPPPTASDEPAQSAQEWLVAITDERQEPASVNEIVAWYSAGVIDADTFVWKDGMAEWQTPFEIPEIAQALEQQGLERRVLEPGIDNAPASVPTYDDEEATHIGRPLGGAATAGTWTEPGRWGGTEGDEQPYDDEMTIAR